MEDAVFPAPARPGYDPRRCVDDGELRRQQGLALVEGQRPDRWDLVGAGVCLVGAAIILFAPHGARG